MSSGDLVVDTDRVTAEVANQLRLAEVESAGAGLEFIVFRAVSRQHGPLALRVPRYVVYRTPGEIPMPSSRLLQQEMLLYGLLGQADFPVPEPIQLVVAAGVHVLVSRFVESDGRPPEPEAAGAALAALHALPVPALDLVTHQDGHAAIGMASRLRRRWQRIQARVADVPDLPTSLTTELLASLNVSPCLLHLDFRSCNLLSYGGALRAIVDWSCAMLAHPACELARLQEFARLPENAIDLRAMLRGYRRVRPVPLVDRRVEILLRLDAVSMLAIVFGDTAPDPSRAESITDRLRELVAELPRRGEQ